MRDDMRILLLGFFTLVLFVPNIVNAQFSSDNFGNDMMDSLSKIGEEIDRIDTKMAELMIEAQLTDEKIDEELSKMELSKQERIVEKLKEMGHDYNGEFITAYNNKMKEKEEAKKTSPFYINQQRQETKMRDLDNKLDLNGSELYALHSFVSLDDLLTIENREDLNRIFIQNSINLNDNSNYPYDDYDHINNYDEYKDYTTIK
jgi:hypothetical protein